MIPTARPMQPPMAMEGRKTPAGTRRPNVAAVMTVFAAAVTLWRRRVSCSSSSGSQGSRTRHVQ